MLYLSGGEFPMHFKVSRACATLLLREAGASVTRAGVGF
jgi:hypothetical protein